MVILKDHADLTTQERHFAGFQAADIMTAKQNVSGTRTLYAANQLQQGTFTRARVSGQKCHFCLLDMKIDALKRLSSAQISFTDLFKANHPY
ncbi:hypothetical protein SRABI106_04153 [Rahnella aquatilis]|nr:hypothetical protein SRABI106_04153 [Rahnella aquatilis]